MFLLVPAHRGSPGLGAVKRLCVRVSAIFCLVFVHVCVLVRRCVEVFSDHVLAQRAQTATEQPVNLLVFR